VPILPSDIRPFSKSPTCPKCLSTEITSDLRRYDTPYLEKMSHGDIFVDWAGFNNITQEYLVRACACSHAWLEWPADKLVIIVDCVPKITEADIPLNRFERVTK